MSPHPQRVPGPGWPMLASAAGVGTVSAPAPRKPYYFFTGSIAACPGSFHHAETAVELRAEDFDLLLWRFARVMPT
jgi:hypothetical protein